jgi:hypothetical protein
MTANWSWLDDRTNTHDMTANSRGLMIVLTHMTVT